MNAGGVAKGVLADDGFVGLHGEARMLADETAAPHDLGAIDTGSQAIGIAPGLDGHHDLFQRGVASPLTDTIDGTFDLPCPGTHGSQAVGDGQAQIVMTVDGDARLVYVANVLPDPNDEVEELLRRRVAHRVGDIHRRRSGIDGRLQQAIDVLGIAPRGVHGRELHVVAVAPGASYVLVSQRQHLFSVLAQLVEEMNLRAGQEDVNTRPCRFLQGLPSSIDSGFVCVGEAAYDGTLHLAGDALDGCQFPRGTDRKPGFDNVDAEAV